MRIFRMYRQRWAVEDSFAFIKDTLGWVAAAFLYELGVTLEWEEVKLLARLGGWVERKGNKPGKIVLTRGLRRLLDVLVTQTILERYRAERGDLPPQIAAFLGSASSGEL